jgi:hypothetical protein
MINCEAGMRNRLLLVLLVLTAAASAFAQRISGELRLQVTDVTGGALRATGTIVGRTAGVDRSFETDESGRATIRSLPFGRYELTIQSTGFAPKALIVDIQSQLPMDQQIGLEVTPLSTTVEVKEETLLDPISTAQYVPRQSLEDRASVAPNRSVINLVNRQPGWVLEANGTLHPRGSEYDVQYIIDGVPLYDNRSPAFAQSVNIDEFESLNVRTSGYPAEFGLKLGGVIETASSEDIRRGIHGEVSLQNGSFLNRAGFVSLRYGSGRDSIGVTGDAMGTHRYLDPPVQENFTNRGTGRGLSLSLERQWSATDHTRLYINTRKTNLMVPNEMLQEQAGQRQDRDGGETLGQLSHTHIFSTRLLGQFRAMARNTQASLWSNLLSTPIRPAQDRGFHETYVAGTITGHYGAHEVKTGAEGWFSSVHENLSYRISAYRLGTVRIFDRDLPENFSFASKAPGRTQSAFVQDSWRIRNFNINAGIRFDHYRLIANENAWSPRLGLAYDVPKAGLVLRGSYDRVFQIPAMENILLASSDEVRNLGGEGAFLPLRPSRGNFVEAGFSKSVSRHVRIDGDWYRRSFENFADDSLLFNTGVSFPIAFSEARVHGLETKIDVRNLGPFAGYVSYANMIGTQTLPVAGGLFLGDDAEELLDSVETLPISQDQRNTVRSQIRYQPRSRFWFAFAASYNSGLPFELEGVTNEAFITQQYGERILERVNFARGRVRPSSSLDVSGGVELVHADKLRLRFQADVFNLANRLNLINFAGVFSGTALDVPRSFSLRLRAEF